MKKTSSSIILKPIAFILLPLTALLYFYLCFLAYFHQSFYPGVKVNGINLTGKSPVLAQKIVEEHFQEKVKQPLNFTYQNQVFTIDLAKSSPELSSQTILREAYKFGRSGNYFIDLKQQIEALIYRKNFSTSLNFKDKHSLLTSLNQINLAIKKDPLSAKVEIGPEIIVTPSENGLELNSRVLNKQLEDYLLNISLPPKVVPVKISQAKFTTTQAEKAKTALEVVRQNPLKLTFEDKSWIIDEDRLLSLLYFGDSFSSPTLNPQDAQEENTGKNILPTDNLLLDNEKLSTYLIDISENINRETLDARFAFDTNTRRVNEFQPAQAGRKLNTDLAKNIIIESLASSPTGAITLPVEETKPQIDTSSVNSYGIEELLGKGVSNFTGSITNRIYNLGLAASRINGILIPPGEVFSFNNTVGDISGASGYKPAYVIKSGRTVLDDGGGVCQVSTTVFRAALNAGLPIIARTSHAYRVGYYEQGFPPGLDATVYAPSVDFKFKNDTSSYILLQAYVEGTSLLVDLYGKNDGRTTTVSKPIITSQTPPLPEVRQDDPTLLKGEVKQVDWPAWGANVSFTRTVTRNGETLVSETWRSNYRPWAAVYLVGAKE